MDNYTEFKKTAAVRQNAMGIMLAGSMTKEAAINLGALKGLFKNFAKAKFIAGANKDKVVNAVRRHHSNILRSSGVGQKITNGERSIRGLKDLISDLQGWNIHRGGGILNHETIRRFSAQNADKINEMRGAISDIKNEINPLRDIFIYHKNRAVPGRMRMYSDEQDLLRGIASRYKRFAKHKVDKLKNTAIAAGTGLTGLGAGIGIGKATNDKKASLDKTAKAGILRAILTMLGGSAAAGGIGAGIGALFSNDKKRGAARGFGIGSGLSLGGNLGFLGGAALTKNLGGAYAGNLLGNVGGAVAGDTIAKSMLNNKKASYTQFKQAGALAQYGKLPTSKDALAPFKLEGNPAQVANNSAPAVGNAQMERAAAAEGVSTKPPTTQNDVTMKALDLAGKSNQTLAKIIAQNNPAAAEQASQQIPQQPVNPVV